MLDVDFLSSQVIFRVPLVLVHILRIKECDDCAYEGVCVGEIWAVTCK